MDVHLTVILRERAEYEMIYITNETRSTSFVIISSYSGKSEKNYGFSKFSNRNNRKLQIYIYIYIYFQSAPRKIHVNKSLLVF